MNFLSPKVTTKDNGDGTQTVTTTSYKADGTKVVKRKTEPIKKHVPENPNRRTRSSFTSVPSLEGVKQVLQEVLGTPHGDNPQFAKAVNRAIPGEFTLLASQDDKTQAQEDYFAKDHYNLPDNKYGKAGSVATCALVQLMNENPKRMVGNGGAKPFDCRQILHQIKTRVHKHSKIEAKPTITSSRPLGPPTLDSNQYSPFYIVPPGFTGKRRALLISVVAGEGDDLKGPPNDVTNIKNFLLDYCGFKQEDIVVLRDDIHARGHKASTKKNIMDGFDNLVKQSKPRDVCFVQFSGHGGRLGDNLYILPSDYKKNGHILDDDILLDLIKYMPAKVYTTMLVDCCYSGTIGDLPYTLHSATADGDPQRIGTYYDTNTRQETIQNEAAPSREYLAKKEARAKWKNVTRLTSIAATYANEFAKDVEKGTSVFAEQARDILEKKKAQAAVAASNAAASARTAAANANQAARTQAANMRRSSKPEPTGPSTRANANSTPPSASGKKPGLARASTTTNVPTQQPRSSSPKATLRRSATTSNPTTTSASAPTPKPRQEQKRSSATPVSSQQPLRRAHTTTPEPSHRAKSKQDQARDFEEAARKAAVGKKEAVAERRNTAPRRSKSFDADAAAQQEEAARQAAVEKSRREAAAAREGASAARSKSIPRRSRTMEDVAMDKEMKARRDAVERSKREAAEARSRTGTSDLEERARKEAVERSKREAAEARARHVSSDLEEKARKEAVERSKKEAAEARARTGTSDLEEKARKEAVERSKREAAEARARTATSDLDERARREAVERSKREAAEARARTGTSDLEEKARKEAVERSKKEAAEARARTETSDLEEKARKEAVERSKKEAAEARAAEQEAAARRAAVEKSRREAAAAREGKAR